LIAARDAGDPQVINLGIEQLAEDLRDDAGDDDAPHRREHPGEGGLESPGRVGGQGAQKREIARHQQVDDPSGEDDRPRGLPSQQLVHHVPQREGERVDEGAPINAEAAHQRNLEAADVGEDLRGDVGGDDEDPRL